MFLLLYGHHVSPLINLGETFFRITRKMKNRRHVYLDVAFYRSIIYDGFYFYFFLLRDSVNKQNAATGPCVRRHFRIVCFVVVNGTERNSSP